MDRRAVPSASCSPASLLVGLLASALVPLSLAAQGSGSVRGTVTRREGNLPIAGVAIVVKGAGVGTSTRADGGYTLPRVPEGAQTLIFRHIGYAPHEATVTVVAGETQTVDAAMAVQTVQLSEIVVSAASRAPERIVQAPAAISVVAPQVLAAVAPTGQAPLALASAPGVDVVQSGINDFNVNARGFNSSLNRRVLVLQDGRDLAIAFLGSQEWSAFASSLDELGRIEVVRGPGSALYGANAFSGVVNITTPTAREVLGQKLTIAGGELSTFRADLRHAGLFGDGRFGYRVSGGYNRSDTWSRSRTSADSTDIVREYDPATDSAVRKSRETRQLIGQELDPATLAAVGDRDPLSSAYGAARLDYYAQSGAVGTVDGGMAESRNEVFVTGIGRVQVARSQRPWARAAWAAERFTVFGWYNGRKSVDPQWSLASGAPLLEKSTILHGEAQYNNFLPRDRGRFILGASVRGYFVNTSGTLMGPTNDDRTDLVYSGYGQLDVQLSRQLKLVGATRFDRGDLFDAQFSPKGAIVYEPVPNHSFRATVNRAFQTPNYSEFFLRANAGAPTASPRALELALESFLNTGRQIGTQGLPPSLPWDFDSLTQVLALGNGQLDVEKVLGYEIGYKGSILGRVDVNVDLYQNDKKDFVTDLLPAVNPAYPRFGYTDNNINVPAYLDAIAARAAALPPGSIPEAQRQQIIGGAAVLRANYNALVAGTQALLATVDGRRALALSYTNAGQVTERGVEVGLGLQITDELRADAAYAFFDFDVKEATVPGDQLLPNTPKHKGNVSLNYAGARGLELGASVRLVSGYPWAAGIFGGYIPAAQTVNANIGYQFTRNFKAFATGTNIFDQKRFQIYGGSVIGRRVIAGVTATF